MNRTDGFPRTLPGSWGIVLGKVILTKAAFGGEVLAKQLALSWFRTCSLPSAPVIVG